MSREIARKIVEDIYSDTYISLKEDVSKIISEKAVDVLQDMKSHVAKKFFSLNEADSDDKSWDRTLDYARQGRSAPTVSTHTGQQYSGVGATRRFGQDLTSGRSPVRDDATRARVAMDAEAGLTRRGTSGLANRPAAGQAPAPATPAQGRAAARGDDMRNPPISRPAAARPAGQVPAPAARSAAAPAARPAAGSQGVTGSEVAATSGGQFMSRADRTNQDKVDSVLGARRYRAGSAEANLALRDYYRQQSQGRGQEGPQPGTRPQTPASPETRAAAVSPQARAAADRLQRPERHEGEQEALRQQTPVSPQARAAADRLQRPERDEGEQEALSQRRAAERATADSLGGPG
jgi:hypothetical protein